MSGHNWDLLPLLQSYLSQEKLLVAGDTVIISVSGGPDSITLLDLLDRVASSWNLSLHIAHINHQIRPAAKADADFVRAIAQKWDYPFHHHTVNVSRLAKKQKMSIEEAARDARRTFLLQIKHQTGADRIALGHTKSDQAETVLLRLIRGAGTSGLGGIRPLSNTSWIRPLLSFSRKQIEQYVQARNLEVRHDETNTDQKFLRNRIRTDLIPHLQRIYNPQIEDVLARTATLLQNDDEQLEIVVEQALSQSVVYRDIRKIILDVTPFFGYHISLRRRLIRKVLFDLKSGTDATSFGAIERILNIPPTPGQSVQVSPALSAHRTQNALIITRPAEAFSICVTPGTEIDIKGTFTSAIIHDVNPDDYQNTGNDTVYFDWDQLPYQKLHLRSPQSGDRFLPFGMRGQKKVSRLFNDLKIARPIRDEVPLLISKDTILWVAGLRRAQIAPVTSKTRRVLKATYKSSMQSIITQLEKRTS